MTGARTEGIPSRYDLFVGGKTGLIKYVVRMSAPKEGPEVNMTQPDMPFVSERGPGGDHDDVRSSVAGKAGSFEASLQKCVGETVERYCFFQGESVSGVEHTYEEARERRAVVDAEYLDPFRALPEGTSVVPIRERGAVEWIPGTDLHTGEDVWMPKDAVFFAGDTGPETDGDDDDDVRRVGFQASTNGCATAWTPEVAVRRGIYEYVERDAFLRAWFSRTPGTEIRLDTETAVDDAIHGMFGPSPIRPRFFLLESRIEVPVVYCLLENPAPGFPEAVFGISAGTDVVDAATEALYEAGQQWVYAVETLAERYDVDDVDLSEAGSQDQSLFHYAHPSTPDGLSFATGSESRRLSALLEGDSDVPSTCPAVLAALRDAGLSAYAFDMTTPDVAPTGVHVVRTYVPELLPFSSWEFVPSRHPQFTDDMVEKPHPLT